jgi:hypothetical protein
MPVDKEKKVLLSESDKSSWTPLFGFLTMPLGTIARLLGKQSRMGCLDELLLKPLNDAASSHCRRLKRLTSTTPSGKLFMSAKARTTLLMRMRMRWGVMATLLPLEGPMAMRQEFLSKARPPSTSL